MAGRGCRIAATLLLAGCPVVLLQAAQPVVAGDIQVTDSEEALLIQSRPTNESPQRQSDGPLPISQSSVCPRQTADWIVVGGGGAGCAAAAALADAGASVLVLERGPSDLAVPSTQTLEGWPASVNEGGQNIRWTDGVWGVVAKVLGGGTSLNGGLLLRDHDTWFKKALPGVKLARMHKSYEVIKRELGAFSEPTTFGVAWNRALTEEGFGKANLSDPKYRWTSHRPFLSYSSFNVSDGGTRNSAAHLLRKRSKNPKLQVLTHALVQRIVFNGTRAIGVEAVIGSGHNTHPCDLLRARKGVLMAAGAVLTPQLLQVSGIGPSAVLKSIGVEVLSDLPVGKNFVDRLVTQLGLLSSAEVPLTVGYTADVDPQLQQVIEGVGGGKITTELGVTTIGFVPPADRTEVLRVILKDLFEALPASVVARINQMIQPVNLQTDTHSRGEVVARSTDISAHPDVTANYFADPRDWASQKLRFQQLLNLSLQPAIRDFTIHKKAVPESFARILQEKAPQLMDAFGCLFRAPRNDQTMGVTIPCGPESLFDSEEAQGEYLQNALVSSYHYFGTAAAGAVVDQTDFSVRGVSGLYVVDASVIPRPTNANPQATIMALGHYIGSLLGGSSADARPQIIV